MAKAIVVKRSGSIKKGPSPLDLNPQMACNNGLEVRMFTRNANEKIVKPNENGDLVFR